MRTNVCVSQLLLGNLSLKSTNNVSFDELLGESYHYYYAVKIYSTVSKITKHLTITTRGR